MSAAAIVVGVCLVVAACIIYAGWFTQTQRRLRREQKRPGAISGEPPMRPGAYFEQSEVILPKLVVDSRFDLALGVLRMIAEDDPRKHPVSTTRPGWLSYHRLREQARAFVREYDRAAS